VSVSEIMNIIQGLNLEFIRFVKTNHSRRGQRAAESLPVLRTTRAQRVMSC